MSSGAAADKAAAGRSARAKGQRAERQVAGLIADLTGWTIKRRVRQHAGDSDLEGIPGWTCEVKDRAGAKLGDVRAWWAQTVRQTPQGSLPVLFYKRQPGEWRAVWPQMLAPGMWSGNHDWTLEGTLSMWAALARDELVPLCSTLLEQNAAPCAAEIAQEAATPDVIEHGGIAL